MQYEPHKWQPEPMVIQPVVFGQQTQNCMVLWDTRHRVTKTIISCLSMASWLTCGMFC